MHWSGSSDSQQNSGSSPAAQAASCIGPAPASVSHRISTSSRRHGSTRDTAFSHDPVL